MFNSLNIENKFADTNLREKFIAIGDIHASISPLKSILAQCEDYKDHTLLFLGDFFDYGLELSDVLDEFRQIKRKSIFLIGNHEVEFFLFYQKYGKDKLSKIKILNHFGITDSHLHWLKENLKLSYENHFAFFSHAGVNDLKDLNNQNLKDLTSSSFKENLDHVSSKLIIQGHIPLRDVMQFGNHIFTDTFCGLGGFLSAYVFPEHQILSSYKK